MNSFIIGSFAILYDSSMFLVYGYAGVGKG